MKAIVTTLAAALLGLTTLLAAGADPNATCPKEPAGFTPHALALHLQRSTAWSDLLA